MLKALNVAKSAINYMTGNKEEKTKEKKGIEETETEGETETETEGETEPEETEEEQQTDNESLKSLKSISPAMRKKPLRKRITPEEEEEQATEAAEPEAEEPEAETTEATPAETEATEAAEPEEKKIIPIKEETKITTYKDIFKTIEDFYEQNKGIEETFTKLESVINNMSDKMFDETFETVAEGIFNTTINGKKVFNTLEDAKKFIYEIRYNGKRGFRGQNTLKYKLPKKLQEGLKQEKQEKQQLTPMMQRNIKRVPSSKYIYQY